MKAEKVKVLLADDYDVVRAGVRTMVEARGWEVCAEATNEGTQSYCQGGSA